MYPHVKQELRDEPEIRPALQRQPAVPVKKTKSETEAESLKSNYNNFLLMNHATDQALTSKVDVEDEESIRGRFGWVTLGTEHIPYIIRRNEKYCSVLMVELKVLNKAIAFLYQDICSCTCIPSYFITYAESLLFNEINKRHCDFEFGRHSFTNEDLIVRLSDVVEFRAFLDTCYRKLQNGSRSTADRCGFIRVGGKSVVPYTLSNQQKYVPLFYFDGEIEEISKKSHELEGWDLAYLKFCCTVQGIRNEFFAKDVCSVIGLDEIKAYFPAGTVFEEYWPDKVAGSQLFRNGNTQSQVCRWARKPVGLPPVVPKYLNFAQHVEQPKTPLNFNFIPDLPSWRPPFEQPASSIMLPRTANTAIRNWLPPTSRLVRRPFYPMTSAPSSTPQTIHSIPTPTNSQNAATPNCQLMVGQTTIVPMSYNHGVRPPHLANTSQNCHTQPQRNNCRSNNTNYNGLNMPIPSQITIMPVRQQPLQNQIRDENQNIPNGRSSSNTIQQELIPLLNASTNKANVPYKLHGVFIENMMYLCINKDPYVYTELLIAITDLVVHLFHNVPVQSCQQVMAILGIEPQALNKSQMKLLYENGRCQSMDDVVLLVPLRKVLQFMLQLKYMLGNLCSEDQHHTS